MAPSPPQFDYNTITLYLPIYLSIYLSSSLNVERRELKQFNIEYYKKFGFVFLIFASGKAPSFMLQQIKMRIGNDSRDELLNAAKEQEKITELRLVKLNNELTPPKSRL
jgi:2-oxo-4-hydroxy-4-carboxy--5-ureidoimidazoline (OHCU) decarboxylase